MRHGRREEYQSRCMSSQSDFPLDGLELSTAVGRWTARVGAIDVAGGTSTRIVVLELEGTPTYTVRLHFASGMSLPSRAAGDDIAGLVGQLREWLESADPKARDLVVGEPALRRNWRRPAGGFPFTITQGIVHILVPPNATSAGFEITLQHLTLDSDYRQGMGILYDRRLAPAPAAEYVDAVVALMLRYGEALGRCRWAVLVRSDDAQTFEIVRLTSSRIAPSADPRAFTDRGEALRWLRRSR
jgi:hypothetical protein